MNWRGGRWNLYGSFTDEFTDGYIINYYFNLFRRWGVKNPSVNFEFRTKFFNDPPYFSWSVGKSVGNMTRSEMHLMHTLWNSRGPSGLLSVKLTRRQRTDGYKFVGMDVGDVVAFQVIISELSVKCRQTSGRRCGRQWCGGISSNYFWTLCERPMDLRPSMLSSVRWWHFKYLFHFTKYIIHDQ